MHPDLLLPYLASTPRDLQSDNACFVQIILLVFFTACTEHKQQNSTVRTSKVPFSPAINSVGFANMRTRFVVFVPPSVCPTVCMYHRGFHWMDVFPYNFYSHTFVKICRKNRELVKIGHKFRSLYVETQVRFIVAYDINLLAPEFGI
jgi:hypothetical protein